MLTTKTKSYLHCVVTMHNGKTFENPLALSEVHLIGRLAAENARVDVSRHKVSVSYYNTLFGIKAN